MPKVKKIRRISFAVFSRYADDFRGYFLLGTFGDLYRKEEVYKACTAANPQFIKLSTELQHMKNSTLLEYRLKLYYAFKLMRPYAQKESDILIRTRIQKSKTKKK